MGGTYQTDFDVWTGQTAQLLREGRWAEIDTEHLIEEIEDLGKRDRWAVVSQLIRLLLHLLRWEYQPERRSDSWLDSMTDARVQIELAFEDSPSLRSYLAEQVESSYQRACCQATKQTGLETTAFEQAYPYALAQVLSEGWLPADM